MSDDARDALLLLRTDVSVVVATSLRWCSSSAAFSLTGLRATSIECADDAFQRAGDACHPSWRHLVGAISALLSIRQQLPRDRDTISVARLRAFVDENLDALDDLRQEAS